MKRPNLVIIQTDQLARFAVSAYGANEVSTPNIDRIAEEGVILNEFYTPSAVCTPSRGCFMTGRYPHSNGAFRNDERLFDDEVTFAHVLRDNGYNTGYVGKWHLDGPNMPGWVNPRNSKGFTECKYMANGGHQKYVAEPQGEQPQFFMEPAEDRTYMTDYVCNKGVDFLSRQTADKPFLLMVSIPDPHTPYSVRPPYDTMFDPKDVVVPDTFDEDPLPDFAESDKWGRHTYFPIYREDREQVFRKWKSQYLGEVKCIDDNVVKITDKLEEMGFKDNTILIFTTDHGDYMGEHGLMHKNNQYKSVYHIPFVMSYPGVIPAGLKIDKYVNIVDFMPTILDLMGVPASGREQGRSVLPLLLGKEMDYPDEIYVHPNDVPRTGIMTPDYHLVFVGKGSEKNTRFKDHLLFDLKKDPKEIHNLYKDPAYQEVIRTLAKKIIAHHKSVGTDFRVLPDVLKEFMD